MSEERSLRETFKKFDKELQKSIREAEKAWAITHGIIYTGSYTFASIGISKGALQLLAEKLSKIGVALALKAELLALEKGKKSIDKRTMKTILDSLEKGVGSEANGYATLDG